MIRENKTELTFQADDKADGRKKSEIAAMYALVITALFGLFGFLYVTWKIWTSKFAFAKSLPTIPWIGSVLSLESKPHKLFRQLQEHCKLHKGFALIWLSFRPMLMTTRVKLLEQLLSSNEMTKKSALYWILHDWLGTGLLTSFGVKWKKRRRIITPSFHFAILNDFIDIFVKQAGNLVQQFEKVANSDKAIDVQVTVSLATLDIICETAMGVEIAAQTSKQSEYVKAVFAINKFIEMRMFTPWYWPKFLFSLTSVGRSYYKSLNILHGFTAKVIDERIQSRVHHHETKADGSSKKKMAFLDMLLDLYDKGDIDIGGMQEEVNTFMFEGHDTTASGISWTLYLLGRHLSAQEKLHAEIDRISKQEGKVLDKIHELKYLDYVIKESLRLHPPVSMFGRLVEKDTLLDGCVIPEGTTITVNTFGVHRNPEYWNSPDAFIPERFGEEQYQKRNPYSYVPFSAGPRNCVGQKFAMLEMKVMVYHILSKFRLLSTQSEDEIEGSFEIIHRSNNGLKIKFFSRD